MSKLVGKELVDKFGFNVLAGNDNWNPNQLILIQLQFGILDI